MDEFKLIKYMTSSSKHKYTSDRLQVGIGDDAAVGEVETGHQIVMTCDTMVETVHFNDQTMLDEDIGYKALAANISDIAAMGAIPRYALVALSIPLRWNVRRLRKIYDGIYTCAEQFGVDLAGGDTTSSPRHLTISITLIGEVESGRALQRSAAVPGDVVFITGFPGRAAGGLHALQSIGQRAKPLSEYPKNIQTLCLKHRRPEPRVEAGRTLLAFGGHALNDISDGVASEAHEIAEASGVTMRLFAKQMPVDPELRGYAERCGLDPLRWILGGGEDYELIGTLPAKHMSKITKEMKQLGVPFHVIGKVLRSSGASGGSYVEWEDEQGHVTKLDAEGYRHFSS